MSSLRSSAELKAAAKEHMFGHYGTAIGAWLLVTVSTMFFSLAATAFVEDTTTVPGMCLYITVSYAISVLTGLLASGSAYFYLKIVCGQHVTVNDIFYGFRFYPDKALLIQAWTALFTYVFDLPRFIVTSRLSASPDAQELLIYAACTILSLIVPVIINLFYGQAFFLLHDFPQYTPRELLATSRRLTRGRRLKLLYIYVSFLPYLVPCVLSCGIAMLWVLPYINATLAEFYLDLVREQK